MSVCIIELKLLDLKLQRHQKYVFELRSDVFFYQKIANIIHEHMDIIWHKFVNWDYLEEAAEIYSLSVYLNLFLSKFSIVMQKTAIHELKTLLELHFWEIAKYLSPCNLNLLKVDV